MGSEPNTRLWKRVKTSFYMKLRGEDAAGKDFEEVVKTVDISKAGACFISDRNLPIGSKVYLSIPLPATIVRIDKYENSNEHKYGVIFRPYDPDAPDTDEEM